jgi:A118 family predicted phage portal protein
MIFHAVYDGSRTELGLRKPLGEFEATLEFADLVDEQSAIPTGVDQLTVVYVPNVRPNRLWRKISEATYFGRSDFAGIEPAMDRLDMVWSSWMRDVRLGLARLVVPQSALQSFGSGQGAYFDLDRELMVGLDLSLGPDEGTITQVQFAIRVDEHSRTCSELLEQIVRGAGYSMQTFDGSAEGGAQTATEVSAKERRTLTTRDRKIGYWSRGIRQALEVLMAVDVAQFGASISPAPVKIEFPDAVSDPPETQARTIQLLSDAKAISERTKIQMLHPDWTPDQITQEMALIKSETPAPPPPAPAGPTLNGQGGLAVANGARV